MREEVVSPSRNIVYTAIFSIIVVPGAVGIALKIISIFLK